jgi:hypothetical protein
MPAANERRKNRQQELRYREDSTVTEETTDQTAYFGYIACGRRKV